MEKKQESKKTKSLTQKAKKIRSVVMMTLLCVLLMSAATYAWFTLSNTAKATNLTMTVGDTTGLQIAEDNNNNAGSFGSSIQFNFINGKLLPATTTNGYSFFKPSTYDESGAVTAVEAVGEGEYLNGTTSDIQENASTSTPDSSAKEGYYIQYKFWLKSLGKEGTTTDIKLASGTGSEDGVYVEANKGNYSGTYLLSKSTDSTIKIPGSAAVRMSFTTTSESTTKTESVYEPNSNITNGGYTVTKGTDFAENKLDNSTYPVKSTIKRNADGTVISDSDNKVITLKANEPTQITLYIWIEGTDNQCVNQISAKDIIGQLEFIKPETTVGN